MNKLEHMNTTAIMNTWESEPRPILFGCILLAMAVALGCTLRDNPNTGTHTVAEGVIVKSWELNQQPVVSTAYYKQQNPNDMNNSQRREIEMAKKLGYTN